MSDRLKAQFTEGLIDWKPNLPKVWSRLKAQFTEGLIDWKPNLPKVW